LTSDLLVSITNCQSRPVRAKYFFYCIWSSISGYYAMIFFAVDQVFSGCYAIMLIYGGLSTDTFWKYYSTMNKIWKYVWKMLFSLHTHVIELIGWTNIFVSIWRFLSVRMIFFFSQICQVCNVPNYLFGNWTFLSVRLIYSIVRFFKSVVWLNTCLVIEDICLSDGWTSLLVFEEFYLLDWFFSLVWFLKSVMWLIPCLLIEDIFLSDGWISLSVFEDFCLLDWFFSLVGFVKSVMWLITCLVTEDICLLDLFFQY